jgi:acyl-coenzyme A synthetase/AMP-(fatty) acid ligase
MNITDIIRSHGRTRPTHPAVEFGSDKITYREFDVLIDATAARLHSMGIRTGDQVGLVMFDSIVFLAVYYGLARLGAAIMPIEPYWPKENIEGRLQGFDVSKVIVGERAMVPDAETVIHVDTSWRDPSDAYPLPDFPDDGNLPFLMVFSSGTTGKPKGPLLTHRQMMHQALTRVTSGGMNAWDRFGSLIDLCLHIAQLNFTAVHYLGATQVLFSDRVGAEDIPEAFGRAGITAAFITPRQMRVLLPLGKDGELLMPYLRSMTTAGAPIFADEREATRRLITPNFFEDYGSNEGGRFVSSGPDDQIKKPDSVGRVIPSIEAQVVDENDDPVSPGEIGIIRFRGEEMAKEYYKNPEGTAAAFHDGWFYPKDAALIDEDGYVFLKGRTDDVINVDGHNVYPADVEDALISHPAVKEASVVGFSRPDHSEVPVAFVVALAKVQPEELRDHCRHHLPYYKVPRGYVALEEMPRNRVGKILKTDLKKMAEERFNKA